MSQFEQSLLFKRIVDQQSLAKAAQQSGLNPSAVSKQLVKLEKSLGTQLLKRTTRRLVLTEAGHYFYEKITRLQHEWLSTVEETTSLGKAVQGTLRIAAPQVLFSRFLMPLLAEFRLAYPSIDFELIHQQIDQLPLIDADICISREIPEYDSSSVVMTPFYNYQNQLFASPNYWRQHSTLENLSQLQHHCCIVYGKKNQTVSWEFESETVVLENIIATNSAEIMISASKNDLGIIYLPKEILQEELRDGELIPVMSGAGSKKHKTCAYYSKADFIPQKIRVFIDFLKQKNYFFPA